ncbi:acetyltransferase fmaC [Aspergillus melleus]|uniref:acetyltransferase fmaC n=1 Tax=Aspergillus melleus TaxID=138277 RepID=UPI001E8D93F3|nr:uncharacterized protein LDX57_001885 [Aspergillus melleus]KAH8424131.1 hypothetical protein LDX57_001885 [Aspergillus melleus]
MLLPETAENFQSLGYNVLLYDTRSVGGSDGEPRNQPSPYQMAEDVSDVITYASSLPTVDNKRILLWGISFGAAVNACTVAVDRRAKGLIMVCPLLSFIRKDRRGRTFTQVIKDRQSQQKGNAPYSMQPHNSAGDNIAGLGGAGGPGGLEAHLLMRAAAERGHPNFRDRITIQTYHKLAYFRPKEIMETIEGVPVLMIIPELDNISPPEEQKTAWDGMTTPKQLFVAKNGGHLGILSGEGSLEVFQRQADFYKDVFEDRVK